MSDSDGTGVDKVIVEDVDNLLEEETEEERQFRLSSQSPGHLQPSTNIGLVHSPTTDTLDSVYLEPSPTEDDAFGGQTGGLEGDPGDQNSNSENLQSATDQFDKLSLGSAQDVGSTQFEISIGSSQFEISAESKEESTQDKAIVEEGSVPVSGTDTAEVTGVEPVKEEQKEKAQPSLSSYFASESSEKADDPFSTNFFDNIGATTEVKIPTPQSEDLSTDIGDIELDLEDFQKELLISESHVDDQACEDSIQLGSEELTEQSIEQSDRNVNNNNVVLEHGHSHHHIEHVEPETVPFDLDDSENMEPTSTPEALDEKDDFESFTAETVDTEALDALGMSPAQTFLGDQNAIKDYFRQMSQADSSVKSDFSRQQSVSSNRSSTCQEQSGIGGLPTVSPTNHTFQPPSPTHMTPQSTPIHQALYSSISSAQTTPSHKPKLPEEQALVSKDEISAGQEQDKIESESVAESKEQTGSPIHSPEQFHGFQPFSETGVEQDPFSASLLISDVDRHYNAWIPSDLTKGLLVSLGTSAPGAYTIGEEDRCFPKLVITEAQGDPVRDLVYRYMGEQEALKRQVLASDNVSQDIDGLKRLLGAGCLRSAIDLTGRLLTAADLAQEGKGQENTPDTLQIWFCRLSLFMRLRMYSAAEAEFAAFRNLDTPDLYYEFYPQLYPGKRGSMVPFGMRLIHAEVPHHLGRSQEALDRIYYILLITLKIVKNLVEGLAEDGSAIQLSSEERQASLEVWLQRERTVLYTIANILMGIKDYEAALNVLEILLAKDPDHKVELLSGIGRIYLQMGNAMTAGEYFQQSADIGNMKSITAVNRGFLAMCKNNFDEAFQNFSTAVEQDPANAAAVNNMAVCSLYLGRLKEALKTLEALVHRDPEKHLHEGILFNLCTLYELESSRALHKKQALLDLVSKHKGDGFPVICLKMA